MDYNESALDEFLGVLQRQDIYSLLGQRYNYNKKGVVYLDVELPSKQKFSKLLFPYDSILLFGATSTDTNYKTIYKKINDAIPKLGISYIEVNDRDKFNITITMDAKLAEQAKNEYEQRVETRNNMRQILKFADIRKEIENEEATELLHELVSEAKIPEQKRGGTRRILRNAKSRKHRGHRTSKQLLRSKKSIKIRKPRKLRK